MSEPFLGEIRNFGFNFAPQGWAQCQGQLLSISQNSALFSARHHVRRRRPNHLRAARHARAHGHQRRTRARPQQPKPGPGRRRRAGHPDSPTGAHRTPTA